MVTRDELIAYLLHRMPEEARAALAEQWIADPELHQRLRMVEAELFDAYARGEASAEERRLIETHLLGSDSQRQKLAFAEALHTAIPRPRATMAASRGAGIDREAEANGRERAGIGNGGGDRAGWHGLPLAAAAIVLLAASSAWLLYRNITLSRQLASIASAAPTAGGPVLAPGPAPSPPPPVSPPVLVTMALRPDDLRGAAGTAEARLAVPPGAEVVRLDLELAPADRAAAYTIALSTGGTVVWRTEPVALARSGAALSAPCWIPTSVLSAGRYEVAVSAGGQPIAFYHFRVDTN